MQNSKSLLLTALGVTLPVVGATFFSGVAVNDLYSRSLLVRQISNLRTGLYSNQTENNALFKEDRKDATGAITPSQDIVTKLRDDGLPISAIAEMINVERKTIYSWISGAPIKNSNQERLESIYQILSERKEASYKNLYRYWNRNIDGVTLASLLKQEYLNKQKISEVLSILWPLAKRTESQLAMRPRKGSAGRNPIFDEMSEAFISDGT